MKNIDLLPPRQPDGDERSDEDVVKRRERRRLFVIGQSLPFDPILSKPLSPDAALFIAP
jgi:hypothetical protein